MMNRNKEWNEFVKELYECASKNCPTEREEEYRKAREDKINGVLSSDLTIDQRKTIENILFELGVNAERDAMVLYQQGMRDGIWLLKKLGVLV